MKNTLLNIFAISIAFTGCAVGIVVFMWAFEATGHELIPGHQVENWFKQGAFIVTYALLAGFLVDTVRWITSVAWVSSRNHGGQKARSPNGPEVCLSD